MLLGTVLLNLGCLIATVRGLAINRRDNASSQSNGPVIDLGYAKYQGNRPGTGVDEFLGMRYAKPPLGNLRFRAPLDPLSEFTVQDASKVSSRQLHAAYGRMDC